MNDPGYAKSPPLSQIKALAVAASLGDEFTRSQVIYQNSPSTFDMLMRRNLIEVKAKRKGANPAIYAVTDKGYEFLWEAQKLGSFIEQNVK